RSDGELSFRYEGINCILAVSKTVSYNPEDPNQVEQTHGRGFFLELKDAEYARLHIHENGGTLKIMPTDEIGEGKAAETGIEIIE
ncbi:MAG TPA: hypothetical protein PK263_05745, partial [bacterium]|nr:hypothetical protein [bacterium]